MVEGDSEFHQIFGIVLEMILRTRERCDQLAAEGFLVILPDYFRGNVPEECGPGDFACWGGENRHKCSVFLLMQFK